jgi:hypothetical protein
MHPTPDAVFTDGGATRASQRCLDDLASAWLSSPTRSARGGGGQEQCPRQGLAGGGGSPRRRSVSSDLDYRRGGVSQCGGCSTRRLAPCTTKNRAQHTALACGVVVLSCARVQKRVSTDVSSGPRFPGYRRRLFPWGIGNHTGENNWGFSSFGDFVNRLMCCVTIPFKPKVLVSPRIFQILWLAVGLTENSKRVFGLVGIAVCPWLAVFSSLTIRSLLFAFYARGFRAHIGNKPMVLLNGIITDYALFYIIYYLSNTIAKQYVEFHHS